VTAGEQKVRHLTTTSRATRQKLAKDFNRK
jgi:hypothetical protein